MITDKLIARLKERFPHANAKFGAAPGPVVVFPGVHPDVGDIQIFDDGGEVTLIAGNFTHGHFSDYNSDSVDEAERNIVEDVVEFLERLFADKIVLWGSHKTAGGWYDRERARAKTTPALEQLILGNPLYVWSGPVVR